MARRLVRKISRKQKSARTEEQRNQEGNEVNYKKFSNQRIENISWRRQESKRARKFASTEKEESKQFKCMDSSKPGCAKIFLTSTKDNKQANCSRSEK